MTDLTDLRLDRAAAAAILEMSVESISDITFLRPYNHTWRITADGSTYFVKAHTKDWYDGDHGSGTPVRHELTGHRTLRTAGLSTAQVIGSSTSRDNPLGWPYLVTRGLAGDPLADLLATLSGDDADGALRAAGRYLAGMHRLTFEHPGYLIDGPPTPPEPNQWLHWLSRPERFLLYLSETLTADAADVDLDTRDAAAGFVEQTLPRLRADYEPLRFVHGDCHANVFYLTRDARDGWHVSGILDLENCSAGAPAFDFVKLFIELTARVGATHTWWQPLFEGYGTEPDFDLIKLLLIGHGHINYACHGPSLWPARREDVLRHILRSQSWAELFAPRQDAAGQGS